MKRVLAIITLISLIYSCDKSKYPGFKSFNEVLHYRLDKPGDLNEKNSGFNVSGNRL